MSDGTPDGSLDPARFDPTALGPLGRTLTLDPPEGALVERPATRILDPPVVDDLLADHRDRLGDLPAPVVASSWAKHLSTVLVPGILGAWTLQRLGLDASPRNLALHLDGPLPRRCRILDPTRVQDGDPGRDLALETLFGETLEPLFGTLQERTGVGPGPLWGTVGNLVAYLYIQLASSQRPSKQLDRDRERLLGTETAPWRTGPNPLAGSVEVRPLGGDHAPDRYPVRRVCCLKVEIPGKKPCASCPAISCEQRRKLVAAREASG